MNEMPSNMPTGQEQKEESAEQIIRSYIDRQLEIVQEEQRLKEGGKKLDAGFKSQIKDPKKFMDIWTDELENLSIDGSEADPRVGDALRELRDSVKSHRSKEIRDYVQEFFRNLPLNRLIDSRPELAEKIEALVIEREGFEPLSLLRFKDVPSVAFLLENIAKKAKFKINQEQGDKREIKKEDYLDRGGSSHGLDLSTSMELPSFHGLDVSVENFKFSSVCFCGCSDKKLLGDYDDFNTDKRQFINEFTSSFFKGKIVNAEIHAKAKAKARAEWAKTDVGMQQAAWREERELAFKKSVKEHCRLNGITTLYVRYPYESYSTDLELDIEGVMIKEIGGDGDMYDDTPGDIWKNVGYLPINCVSGVLKHGHSREEEVQLITEEDLNIAREIESLKEDNKVILR